MTRSKARTAAGALTGAFLALLLITPPVAAAETPPAKAAGKKGPTLGPALFDKKKPIEITSDRLDVDQQTKVAVFEGKVDAIQGEVHLRADRLTVYYDAIETPVAEGAAAGEAAGPGAGGGKIRRMDVDGHVFVSSPTETASGDKGVYDAETGKITLFGNVVLTRGGNVIRGTKLAIDVDTGRSVIESGSSAGGLVKGLFVPKKDQNGAQSASPQTTARTTSGSAAAQ